MTTYSPQTRTGGWNEHDVLRLRQLSQNAIPTVLIALKPGRSVDAVTVQAARAGIPLEPVMTNRTSEAG